ncbi:MAG: Fic family protein [Bacteroidota bacterium]
MLPDYLEAFNTTLQQFQEKFPRGKWGTAFTLSLVNDFTFFSSRVEDDKLKYGDTIRFLNNEITRAMNITSLMNVSIHQEVLQLLLEHLSAFQLSEDVVKGIHKALMNFPLAWESPFKPELVGEYRNESVVGWREPVDENKEYVPHYNLKVIMPTFVDQFCRKLEDIDQTTEEKHLLTRLAEFHNLFLNTYHPFADGNGRVCRILIGAIMMKHNCPPIFPKIIDQEDKFRYITTIIECENKRSNTPLIKYFAEEMTKYLEARNSNIN